MHVAGGLTSISRTANLTAFTPLMTDPSFMPLLHNKS
jgi:hypothetical protein